MEHKINAEQGCRALFGWLKTQRGGISYELIPRRESPLFVEIDGQPQPLSVRCDSMMGAYTAIHQEWETEKAEFFRQATMQVLGNTHVSLVDIGANTGLFSRSCTAKSGFDVKLFCYEPEEWNFSCLLRNLSYLPSAELVQKAIARDTGTTKLYLDPSNTGNNAINPETVVDRPDSAQTVVEIESIGVGEAAKDWINEGRPIFFKSDTQGHDEEIVSEAPAELWEHTYAGVIEIRRIRGKQYDIDKLANALDAFPNKVGDKNRTQKLTTSEIIEFSQGPGDLADVDILLWK